jgi:DNA mismatch endonuclease (patch repair protein)
MVTATSDGATDPARSAQMARVRSRDTKPEMQVRRFLHAAGLRFRLHDRSLPGTPDLTFPTRRVAVTVRGCFWHQDPDPACKLARMPKTRLDFWRPKLEGNRARDARQEVELAALGWTLHVVWECRVGDEAMLASIAAAIREAPATWRRSRRPTKRKPPRAPS